MANIKVKTIKDFIVEVEGAYDYVINEIVVFPNKEEGIIMKADTKGATVALFSLSITEPVQVGDKVSPTGKEFSFELSEKQMGNIINVKGEILTDYNDPSIETKAPEIKPVFRLARPIYSRDFVNEPLITGLSSVDWAIPIGKGQRELILGDRETGKTAIALNMIMAQKSTGVKVVYVAIGQKKTTVLGIYKRIKEFGMEKQVVIVTASADQTATKKWLAPYVGATISEYYQEKYGDDVLIIFDDLSKHADAYRELSLLMKSAPAREAYPGDIFYLHSKLLERAGKFTAEFGSGSITAIPIVQTEAGDLTSYIPTNVISITDGQIFTNKQLFNAGHRPAVDIAYSVSRVGSTAQTEALAEVSGGLKLLVSQYNEAKKMARLSSSASEEHQDTIDKGRVLMALLVQPELDVLDYETGALLLSLFKEGHLNFFGKTEEIILIRNILNEFMKNDFLGKRLRTVIKTRKVSEKQYSLYIHEIVLPLIKYYLIEKYPHLKKEEKFIDLYKDVRDDGRVYRNLVRNIDQGGK
ncbi:MAG: F0F1 ATP synthase subunit alpha [Mycoplasmataceae bacterium]|nr:F0F1 ATP synthase subunit alpha [Mycoplasmataceae bacterium]